ncbi:MAG: response regulator [Chloroflexaceae bacterium]|nr:response regulator [Chloroflexaceae bacterium]
MIKVVLADDHHLVRQGIRALLERDKRIQIVGEAPNGQEALELIARHQPDVAIVDIRMPMPNGIMVIEQVRALKLPTRVIILSMYMMTRWCAGPYGTARAAICSSIRSLRNCPWLFRRRCRISAI